MDMRFSGSRGVIISGQYRHGCYPPDVRNPKLAPCCSDMRRNLQHKCDVHSEPEDCPDALVGLFGDEYGLRIHDGGSSYVVISHCPWCGARLPRGNGVSEK